MEETRGPARAGALAAGDEGIRRCARGGRAPQFLKSANGVSGEKHSDQGCSQRGPIRIAYILVAFERTESVIRRVRRLHAPDHFFHPLQLAQRRQRVPAHRRGGCPM